MKKTTNEFLPSSGNFRRKVPFYRRTWFGVLMILFLVGGVAVLAIMLAVIKPLREQAEKFDLETMHKIERASIIYDRKGDELGRIFVLNRTPVKIDKVPSHFINALTAEEDSRFFQHGGVDYIGIARAIYLNYKAHAETQGASTITQQLARDAFKLKEMESGEKTSRYKRKLVEAFVAERIEKRYSKSEILEMYLNRIYFGAGFYGVQAAAQGFFGKDVGQLDVLESATLCGVIKSPNNLQPLRHPDRCKKARDHVLDRMRDDGFITPAERNHLASLPVKTKPREPNPQQTYVYDAVRAEVVKMIGDEAAEAGGFKVYTTVDRQLQKAAEESVKKRLADIENRRGYPHQTYAKYHAVLDDYRKKLNSKAIAPDTPAPPPDYLQAAVLMIDNRDGGILAMIGGRDFLDSMYNRALQSRRPAGTAFVPFVYATAFQKREFYPPLRIEDGPFDNRRVMIGGTTGRLGEWGTEQDVTNYDKPQITAREALLQGRNAATVRLGERIGIDPVKELAQKAGIKSPLRDYQSTFLGASEVRLDEMCLAYSTFANGGSRPKEPTIVHRITDAEGKVIYQVKEDENQMVNAIDEIAAYQTHTCLVDALRRGTGKPAYDDYGLDNFPAAGKTGTHYEFKDLWFVGYTSAITCGVWCGFDQQKPVYEGAFSNRIALPIWVDAMKAARQDYKPEEFPVPENLQFVEVCRRSGLRATDACYDHVPDPIHGGTRAVRDTYKEPLRRESIFDEYCDVHTSADMPPGLASAVKARPDEIAVPDTRNGKLASVEPVRMQGMTILGEDPYNAVQPLLKAVPVNEEGATVKKAVPVEDESTSAPALKLKPPPPLKLDP